MGDFSVPCVVSGVPIAARQKVVAFKIKKARYEDGDIPYAPVSGPWEGIMGDYGYIGDGGHDCREQDAKIGVHTVHAHADLFAAAAFLFNRAMPKEGSLYAEMAARKADYLKEIALAKEQDPVNYGESVRNWWRDHIFGNLPRTTREPWLGLMNHLLICVSDKKTFHTTLGDWVNHMAYSDEFELCADKVKVDIDGVQDLLSVFAASRITGHVIRPHGYTFEQYPTFKWENQWHQTVAKLTKRYANEEVARDLKSQIEDFEDDLKEETAPKEQAQLRQRIETVRNKLKALKS
jgi:hypothetical protein